MFRQQQLSLLAPSSGAPEAWERLPKQRKREAIDQWARLALFVARGREPPGEPGEGASTALEDAR